MRTLIFLLLLLFSPLASAQDTICVTRSEMLTYATNAIMLKQNHQEIILLNYELAECKSTLTKLNESIVIFEQVHVNDSTIIESQALQIKASKRKERNSRIWKPLAIGSTIVVILETIILLKKPQK